MWQITEYFSNFQGGLDPPEKFWLSKVKIQRMLKRESRRAVCTEDQIVDFD